MTSGLRIDSLDKPDEALSEGLMRQTGWIAVLLRVPLCAALAVAFLAMTLAQPGVHAMAKAGAAVGASESAHAMHSAPKAEVERHGSDHQHVDKRSASSGDSSDPLCDIQCAPVSVMPVNGFGLCDAVARCYGALAFSKLANREPIGLIRPPRTLV